MGLTGTAKRWLKAWPVAVATAACAATAAVIPAARTTDPDTPRTVVVLARQWGYEPHRIVARPGESLVLKLVSRDVVHGFFLEGHDLEAEIRPGSSTFRARRPSTGEPFAAVEEVTVVVGRPGKYRYRCSVTCGTLHPFMQGELVVRPNLPFRAGLAGTWGLTAAAFVMMLRRRRDAGPRPPEGRIDLLRHVPILRRIVERRWFQFALTAPSLLVLFLFVVAGLFGSPIGNRNIIVTVVWIVWWFVLITALVPLGGRAWCAACPLPFLGEWFARRRLISVRPAAERSRSLRTGSRNRRWPRKLSGIWLQSFMFLAVCSVSTILVTRPALTAAVLLALVVVAVAVHAIYRRRSFCRYLCPLNAWMSLYAMTAMIEVRPRDAGVCATCREHACAAGSDRGWGCPWLLNPARLETNNYCGLCMECVKSCPNGNLTVLARPFCSDTRVRRLDEAWMAMVMVALVIAYTVTLLGPWSIVKLWANVSEVGDWGGFALHTATVWLTALVLLPGLWYLTAAAGRRLGGDATVSVRDVFVRYAYLLVPLGLLSWAAFSFPLIMVNYSHVTSSLSDPLGWGWDLFGTAQAHWHPLVPEIIPYLQIPLLLGGLGIALWRGWGVARELFRSPRAAALSLLPHGVLCAVITTVLLRLFVG